MSYLRKNMEKIVAVILLSLAFAAPANAADANHWLYLGARLGDSTAGGLLGLQFTRTYSLELSYDYIDTLYQPNYTVKSSTTAAAFVGMFPVKLGDLDSFSVFAKAGYERNTTKATTYDPGIPGLFGSTTTVTTTIRKRAVVSVGAQYDFTRNFSGRIGKNAIGTDHSVYIAAIYQF